MASRGKSRRELTGRLAGITQVSEAGGPEERAEEVYGNFGVLKEE